VQAEVLLNLGREDQLDVAGLRRLARSITRYTEGADGVAVVGDATGLELHVLDARPFGSAWVLDALWHRLGIGRALEESLADRRHRRDVERVLFALVCNRAIHPESKLAAAEWVSRDAAIPGLDALGAQHAYRAMDVLAASDASGRVQEAVFFAVADLLNLEVDLLFFDTTSTYFEIEDEDDHDEQPEEMAASLRRFGHSKDHRPDRPQVVIGLAVTRDGIPVRVWVWPGNTADQTVIEQVKDDLAGWRLGRAVWVVDRGMSSEENLRYLRRGGGHWIAGQRMRAGEPTAEAALARQGRYHQVRDNLRVKEVKLGEGDSMRRFIVCHNQDEQLRDKQRRERAIKRIEQELERIERLRARAGKTGAAHVRAECALRDHPSYSRYLRQLPSGRLKVDRAKVSEEEKLDGKFLLETSDPDITAEDAALGYKNLLEAERSFRDLKGTLRIRPVFHRLDDRIRAHVLICWLALLLVRIAERHTSQTWRRTRTELERIKLVTLAGQAGSVQQTTALTDQQRQILGALDVPAPPAVTSLDPA
jgi:hypothetical protein